MSAVMRSAPGLARPEALVTLAFLATLLTTVLVVAAGAGPYPIAPRAVIDILLDAAGIGAGGAFSPQEQAVFLSIRLPRLLMAAVVGGGLAAAGAAMQGLFRNPLADPGLIGVSSGAALAAAIVIVLGATWLPGLSRWLGIYTLPLAASLGGFLVAALTHALSSRDGRVSLPVMLLAGIAANALAGAGIGLCTYIATDEQLRNLTFWSLGSLTGTNWTTLGVAAPVAALCIAWGCRCAAPLNAMLLGEAEAGHLGIDVARLKTAVIASCALAVGTLVAFTGMIGFVGLVAPHMLRLAAGPDHRVLIPGAALLGGALMVIADTAARTLVAPAEMPIGILTALVGAPFFLALLMRQRQAWGA
jgi:iron complex transport system permease protein